MPQTDPAADDIPDWAQRILQLGQRHGDIPIYGSAEWTALPAADPRKFAAAVRAAECWRQDGTDEAIRRRLWAELAESDTLVRYRISETSRDVAAAYNDKAAGL